MVLRYNFREGVAVCGKLRVSTSVSMYVRDFSDNLPPIIISFFVNNLGMILRMIFLNDFVNSLVNGLQS